MKSRLSDSLGATSVAIVICSMLIWLTVPVRLSSARSGDRNSEHALKTSPTFSKLYFEENRGQVDERARFVSRGAGGYTMFLAATEAVYVMPMTDARPTSQVTDPVPQIESRRPKTEDQKPSKALALRMQFVGSNPTAEVSGEDQLATRANHFKGSDPSRWQTDVPTYSRVSYHEVYPGIDLEFYGDVQNRSEYDFIVAPGSDTSRIELDFAGADSVEIDAVSGELLIHTAAGTIKQTKPFSYQESGAGTKREIASGYEKSGETSVRFRVGEYDPSKPLIIDPILGNLAFSTLLGGADNDFGESIVLDGSGNTYVGGYTRSDLFPTTSGVFDTTHNGSFDGFVTKISADGSSLIYSTYVGGSGSDSFGSIVLDAAGSVYLAGSSESPNYPTTAGAYNTTHNAQSDVVVTKLNATGNQLTYSTFIGGSSSDFGGEVAIDSLGNAYLTGSTFSLDYPTTAGAYDNTSGGGQDVFVTKLNSGGTALVYSTYLGGNSSEGGNGIAIDLAGNVIVTGQTGGGTTAFPTTMGAFDTVYNGGIRDPFVTKLDAVGSALLFSTFLGGNGDDLGYGLSLDSLGNVYVSGYTFDGTTPFPTTGGAYDTTHNGIFDIFVTKLPPSGASLTYSTFLGGSNADYGYEIEVDASGNAYVIGDTQSNDFPATANAYDPVFGGGRDLLVAKLNPAGSGLSYSTFLGGANFESPGGIGLDSANNVYVTGSVNASLFPTTANAFQTEWAGGYDAFVAKLGNFAVSGRAIDVSGSAVQNAMVALSGSGSATTQTDAAGNFVFLDALPNRAYTVSASKAGTVFNPSLFNIANLNDNRNLVFVAGGAPSGGGSGSNVYLSAGSYSTNESANTATIRVWRDLQTIGNSVSVNYQTGNLTATAGVDYQAVANVLTFSPGEVEKTFAVPIIDDVQVEGSESLIVSLSSPTGGATLGTSAATLDINDNGEPQMQTGGHWLSIVASGGVFKGRHIAGIAASQMDGTIYVATDNNFIEPPSGLTNNCGTQPVQNSFDLFRIAPDGTISFVGNYAIPHRSLANLEYNPGDGMLYTVGSNRAIYRINGVTSASFVFNGDVGFDTTRSGLEADASGNLILMRYGAPNSFYRVTAGIGATFLGSYPLDASGANFGDRFGIQPDGDYVVYSDAPKARIPREFEIDTTGHIDGSPYSSNFLSGTNLRTLGSGYIHSNGAVNPVDGDVFTSGGNCSAGSSVILRTQAGGTPSSTTGTFINGIGNNFADGAENFNARGVTDLDFGARRDGQLGKCLYFTDDFNDVIYSSCMLAPTASSASVSGRVTDAEGRPVPRVRVVLSGATGASRSAVTNPFGYFSIGGVEVGHAYIVSAFDKRYEFVPRTLVVNDNVADLEIVALP